MNTLIQVSALRIGVDFLDLAGLYDVCSCCDSRNARTSVARRGLIVACRDLPIICFLSTFWRFCDTQEVKYRNARLPHLIGIVTFILKPLLLESLFPRISSTHLVSVPVLSQILLP